MDANQPQDCLKEKETSGFARLFRSLGYGAAVCHPEQPGNHCTFLISISYCAVYPPSMTTACPVTPLAASLAKNNA